MHVIYFTYLSNLYNCFGINNFQLCYFQGTIDIFKAYPQPTSVKVMTHYYQLVLGGKNNRSQQKTKNKNNVLITLKFT